MANKNMNRHTQEQRSKLLASYKSSGVAQKAWCIENKIPLSTLTTWLNKEENEVKNTKMSWGIVAVEEKSQSDSVCEKAGIALLRESPPIILQLGKLSVRIEQGTDEKLLCILLQSLVSLC